VRFGHAGAWGTRFELSEGHHRFRSSEGFMSTRTGRTIGAAIGAVVFLLFSSELASRVVKPVAAAAPSVFSISVAR
jgi:hypothetical protein